MEDLVGGLEPWNFLTFHILGTIIPFDSEGLKLPPRDVYLILHDSYMTSQSD